MTQAEKAALFGKLHVKGDPLILYNVWDAGSAKTVAKAGAKAIATGSWSVAAALGLRDGQDVPLDMVETVARRIAEAVEQPVTIDFEGGYAAEPEAVARNVARVLGAGAVGINFEDQVVGGEGLHSIADQTARIAAIRAMAEAAGVPFFINARTDLFLKAQGAEAHAAALPEAKERAAAYAEAGASGFFAPGLLDEGLIAELCGAAALPVNIMMVDAAASTARMGELGVGRLSYGPFPYRWLMATLGENAAAALGTA